jgi:hypothetical protein
MLFIIMRIVFVFFNVNSISTQITDHILKLKTSHFHKRISNEFYLTPDSNNQNSKNRHKIKMVLLGFV